MLDVLQEAGYATRGVGKIYDIFAGKGISDTVRIQNNVDGMEKTLEIIDEDFQGLCFVNLVDFDMVYGHRNDIDGYAAAATTFDKQLATMVGKLKDTDILMITADHGCDPGFPGTDHSREYVPVLIYGKSVKAVDLKTRNTFSDIGATVLEALNIKNETDGTSFWKDISVR